MAWLSDRIVRWQREHGRHDLPWQGTRDPYRIWVSEIMLQQTQVASAIGYYRRFLARFPDLRALAQADVDEVMRIWSGLGYYSRARNLHACARCVLRDHEGEFPRSAQALAALPGIGRSTGAAIAALAFGARAAILDGNVRRVLCRFFAVEGPPGRSAVERQLWDIAERELPAKAIEQYTQGLMDLGATLCVRARPDCARCPLARRCQARIQGRTAELPAARPRRESPLRATTMLVMRRGDDVLLERRPPSGIWGGLWSVPQVEAPESVEARIEHATAGMRVLSREPLPAFEHAFTHYRLRVEPLLLVVATSRGHGASRSPDGSSAGAPAVRDAPGQVWLALAEIDSAALAAPVKSLLRRVRDA